MQVFKEGALILLYVYSWWYLTKTVIDINNNIFVQLYLAYLHTIS